MLHPLSESHPCTLFRTQKSSLHQVYLNNEAGFFFIPGFQFLVFRSDAALSLDFLSDYQFTAISSWVWSLKAKVPVSQTMPIPREVGISEPRGLVGRWAATMT